MLVVTPRLQIPLREFQFTFSRSSGPGGQNVNKVSSKATLRWPLMSSPSLPDEVRGRFQARFGRRLTGEGDLVITSQRFRDAGRNVADCLEKLREMLASVAQPQKTRRATKPGRGSIRRRLAQKKQQSLKKQSRRQGLDD